MPGSIVLPIREANILRSRLRNFITLRNHVLARQSPESIHDLRVASRRLRETLDYFQASLPVKWHRKSRDLARRITKSLGPAREAEVTLRIVQTWHKENRLNPVAAEFLIFSEKQRLSAFERQAMQKIESNRFSSQEKLLSRIRGSRNLRTASSGIVPKRKDDFLSFQWGSNIDDDRLHDLRIRTKKFRYALEIYDRLHEHNLGRFLRRLKTLQDLLGGIHDLFIVSEMIRTESQKWDASGLTIIPAELRKIYQLSLGEKTSLYPRVYPLYSAVITNLPQTVGLIWQPDFAGQLA